MVTTKRSPSSKKPAPKRPAARKPAAKKPAARKPAAKKAAAKKPRKPAAKPAEQFPPKPVRAPKSGSWTLLDVPFDDRNTAKWAGAIWDRNLGRWVFDGTELPDQLAGFASQRWSWERWLENELNGATTPPSDSTITLRPHQIEAVEQIVAAHTRSAPGFLLADEVGLGKTFAAIEAVNRIGSDLRVLVLSPLSVVAHWRRSIDLAGSGGNNWCVINYDRTKNLLSVPQTAKDAKRTRTKNKRIATQGKSLVEWDVVICDESHRLKNPVSQRTSSVRNLIGKKPAAFTLWMSATAGQNPLELSYLASALARKTGSKISDLADFEIWAASQGIGVKRGAFGQWQWERNPADLELLHRLLFGRPGPIGMRRKPTDIAGWPEITRVGEPIALSGAERATYDQAWSEFVAELEHSTSQKTDSTNPLVALLRFRQKASVVRIPYTAAKVKDLVEDGFQVAVSVAFTDTATLLREAVDGRGVTSVQVTGSDTSTEREASRIAFQTGEANVVVFTVTEGISLHAGEEAVSGNDAPRVTLIHDPRWSALEVAQIEGRCHRDGQNAVAYYLYAEDTAEEKVTRRVIEKLEDMTEMLDAKPIPIADILG